jgi:hypothetical protein
MRRLSSQGSACAAEVHGPDHVDAAIALAVRIGRFAGATLATPQANGCVFALETTRADAQNIAMICATRSERGVVVDDAGHVCLVSGMRSSTSVPSPTADRIVAVLPCWRIRDWIEWGCRGGPAGCRRRDRTRSRGRGPAPARCYRRLPRTARRSARLPALVSASRSRRRLPWSLVQRARSDGDELHDNREGVPSTSAATARTAAARSVAPLTGAPYTEARSSRSALRASMSIGGLSACFCISVNNCSTESCRCAATSARTRADRRRRRRRRPRAADRDRKGRRPSRRSLP